MMIIVHMNLASGYGGGEIQVSILVNALASKPITQYGYFKASGAYIKQSPFDKKYLLNLPALIALIRKEKGQVILHAHDAKAVHLASILKLFFGGKVVITRKMEKVIKKPLSRLSYRRADKVIAVSQAVKKSLSGVCDNVSVIFDSYSELKYDEDFEKTLMFEGKTVITQIANFLPIKNHDMTIEVARQCKNLNLAVQFLLVGHGRDFDRIKELAKDLLNVHFTGFTPYIGSVLNQTDILFSPSHSEGLGTAIIEAYSKNIPIIASAVGGQLDLVMDNETGILVRDNQAQSYMDAIQRLIGSANLMAEMKVNIPKHLQQFTPENLAANYYQMYCSL